MMLIYLCLSGALRRGNVMSVWLQPRSLPVVYGSSRFGLFGSESALFQGLPFPSATVSAIFLEVRSLMVAPRCVYERLHVCAILHSHYLPFFQLHPNFQFAKTWVLEQTQDSMLDLLNLRTFDVQIYIPMSEGRERFPKPVNPSILSIFCNHLLRFYKLVKVRLILFHKMLLLSRLPPLPFLSFPTFRHMRAERSQLKRARKRRIACYIKHGIDILDGFQRMRS